MASEYQSINMPSNTVINLSAKITLSNGDTIVVNQNNIRSISREIIDRADIKMPNWGIISNTGNLEYIDSSGETLQYAEQMLLEGGLSCEIYLNNYITGNSTLIAKFETQDWSYDNDNKTVSVSLKDDLEDWQEMYVEPIYYNPNDLTAKPFSQLYEYLWNLTDRRGTGTGQFNMLSLQEMELVDSALKTRLERLYCKYPLLEKGTLWQSWEKFCIATQTKIYKNSSGIIICRYDRG